MINNFIVIKRQNINNTLYVTIFFINFLNKTYGQMLDTEIHGYTNFVTDAVQRELICWIKSGR